MHSHINYTVHSEFVQYGLGQNPQGGKPRLKCALLLMRRVTNRDSSVQIHLYLSLLTQLSFHLLLMCTTGCCSWLDTSTSFLLTLFSHLQKNVSRDLCVHFINLHNSQSTTTPDYCMTNILINGAIILCMYQDSRPESLSLHAEVPSRGMVAVYTVTKPDLTLQAILLKSGQNHVWLELSLGGILPCTLLDTSS